MYLACQCRFQQAGKGGRAKVPLNCATAGNPRADQAVSVAVSPEIAFHQADQALRVDTAEAGWLGFYARQTSSAAFACNSVAIEGDLVTRRASWTR